MPADVTDTTFESEVLERSKTLPVVIDLWAPWCRPCLTLGPIIERVVGSHDGAVALVKVNVDENPQIARAFQVQSIPSVFAVKDGKVVDSFVGALPERAVAEWVGRLVPKPSEADLLVAKGDEESLRAALHLEPAHERAIEALSKMLIDRGERDEALALLERIPENAATRQLKAEARLGDVDLDGVDRQLDELLGQVKDDEAARQRFLDLLETLGPDDPRAAHYRKELAAHLF
jgi:putative thioredoxin